MDYIIENWPISAVLAFILLVNTFPKIGKFIFEHVLPEQWKKQEKILDDDLKTKKDNTEWERGRILREEKRRDKEVETLESVGKTLVLMHVALEQTNKDHAAIVGWLERMNTQSEEEHRSMLTALNVIQHLYDKMIQRLEERRKGDLPPLPEK